MSAHRIKLSPGDREFVAHGSETVLEAGLRAGVPLRYRCSNGTCGECRARLVSGTVRPVRFTDYPLTEAEKHQGVKLLCSVAAETDLEIEARALEGVGDLPPQRIVARVSKVRALADEVYELHVRTPRSQALEFRPGQFVALGLRGLLPRYRSLASCPCNGNHLIFHVRRTSGDAFSQVVAERLRPGEEIIVEGPEGAFTFHEEGRRPLLFFCYDTGFAPIKSLTEHVLSLDVERPVHLYWMAVRPGGHYLDNLCRSWTDAMEYWSYTPLLSLGDAESGGGDEVSALERLVDDRPDLQGHDVYVTGPQGVVDAARSLLLRRGLPPERFFAESMRSF